MLAPAFAVSFLLFLQQAQPAGTENPAPPAFTRERAQAAFERLKQLAGDWEAKSTKGWTERASYQVIAGGSVLMEVSYGAHPDDWMATMFHMDGEHLMLTHYCAARNQPRLRATEISADGATITFTYLDATNIPNRDAGHMDKCVIRLGDADHFRSRWTWYAKGKEDWMEEIEHRRAAADSATSQPVSPFEKTQGTPTK